MELGELGCEVEGEMEGRDLSERIKGFGFWVTS